MDNDAKKTTKSRSSASSKSDSAKMSAEDKLKKSIKNLSYTSGGSTKVASSSSSKSTSSSKRSPKSSSKIEERKKVGGVVLDVETIQDATKQKFETRGRRNNVIILVLVFALVVSLVFLAISIVSYQRSKRAPNLTYEIKGDASNSCQWVIENGSQTKFVLEDGLSTGLVYELTSELNIKTVESISVTIEIVALLNGTPIQVDLYYRGDNTETFNKVDVSGKNIFTYAETTYSGGGKLHIFDGIDFTDTPHNLTSKNVTLQVIASVEFV